MSRPNHRHGALLGLLLLGAVAACAPIASPGPQGMGEPANVGDAKIAAVAYHDSDRYDADLRRVTEAAASWLVTRTPTASRPALVFDVDETALSNWPVIVADDFGRVIPGPCDHLPAGPCGWEAWDMKGMSTALEPTLALHRRARELGVAVFFITGRPENQRIPTERNLRAVGYTGFEQLVMPANGAHFASAADFKAPSRAMIERMGFTIIANVGDQPSDLTGGHAEKTFLLPNPFYRIP